jgi:hypothetical protein
MKKYIIGSILGVAVIIGSVCFFLNRNQQTMDSVFKAIPLDASVIIDIKDYTNLRNNLDSDNPIWKSLSSVPFFNEIESKLSLLDSLKKQSPELKNLISINPQIFVSFHPTGKDEFMPVYYFKVPNPSGFRMVKGIIENMPGVDITERSYEGETVRDIILTAHKGNFSCVYLKGLLVISKSSILVENVIRQLEATESVIQKKGLEELTKSAGKNYPLNIYARLNSLPRFLSGVFYAKYKDALNFIGNSGGWTELDVNIKKGLLILNGFTTPAADSLGLSTIFKDQQPQKLGLFSKIPSNAVAVIALGISNIDKYWLNYQNFIEHIGLWKSFALRRDSVVGKYSPDLRNDFKSIFDNECGIVIIPGRLDSLNACSFSLVRIKSQDDAEKMINSWVKFYSDSVGTKAVKYISEVKMEDDNSFKIFHLPGGNIPAALFGATYELSTNEYCLINDNYLVFGSSPQALKDYISYLSINNALSSDLEFNDASENSSSASNFYFYLKPSAPIDFYKNYLKSAITDPLSKKIISLNSVNSLIYQFSINDKSLIYNNILVKSNSGAVANSPQTLWDCKLEGKVTMKPVFLKNQSSGESDIFVQDDKNIIYLINGKGLILWKQNLDGPVLSSIFPIDYYRNRKIQYLFNTKSKIYLVDRLGNNIEKYPITLRESATNGIAVFDYDKNRKYRIFYATENRKILLLDKEGKQQNGWDFGKTDGLVTKPLQHFEDGNSDYLVFSDQNRIYIVNRKGAERIKPNHNFLLSVNNPVFFIPGSKKQRNLFAATDPTGTIHLINSKGDVTDVNLGNFSSDHFFEVLDVNSDNKVDFVFSCNQQIVAYSQNKSEHFRIKTEYPLVYRPDFYEVSSGKFEIGVVSPDREKIYLFDTSGNIHKGFPLTGASQFSIQLLTNSENRFNLIVGSNKNFLYNYSVL